MNRIRDRLSTFFEPGRREQRARHDRSAGAVFAHILVPRDDAGRFDGRPGWHRLEIVRRVRADDKRVRVMRRHGFPPNVRLMRRRGFPPNVRVARRLGVRRGGGAWWR